MGSPLCDSTPLSRKHIVKFEAMFKGALASTWLDISEELLFT